LGQQEEELEDEHIWQFWEAKQRPHEESVWTRLKILNKYYTH